MSAELMESKRERLVQSAKAAFAQGGYAGTSISQIVHQAGVARGTFYQHFDNKAHLFQSILESFLDDLEQCMRPISLDPISPSPRVQVEENLARVLKLVLGERDLTRVLMHHASSVDPAVGKRLDDFYERAADMIERSLKLGMAMRLVRRCNTRLTAYSIIGAVKEVVFQLVSSPRPQPPLEELVRELMEFGIGGILAGDRLHLLGSSSAEGGAVLRQHAGGRVVAS